MNFQVPQFIEIEDKVIGPLTFLQFVYLAGGAGLAFLCYTWLGFYLGAIPIVAIGGLAMALAFYKINGRPFIFYAESMLRYFFSNKLYLWKKSAVKKETAVKIPVPVAEATARDFRHSRLRELSWSLNVKELSQPEEKNQ